MPLLDGPSEPKVACRDPTHTGYDVNNRTIATIEPLGQRTSLAHDADERPIRVQSQLGRINTSIFDAAARKRELC